MWSHDLSPPSVPQVYSLKIVVGEGVLPRQLGVVGDTAAIVVLGTYLVVRLSVNARAVGITLVGETVEDVLQLILVVARLGEQGEVEHGSNASVVVILVVGGVAQVVAAVVGRVIHAEEVVDHVAVRPRFVSIVDSSHHT